MDWSSLTPPTTYGPNRKGLSKAVALSPAQLESIDSSIAYNESSKAYDKCVENISRDLTTQKGRDAYNAAVVKCRNETINKRGGSRKKKNKRSKKAGRSKRFRKKFKSPFLF